MHARPSFAVVREDPRLELALLARRPGPALVVASGGCTALALATAPERWPVTAFDRSPLQLDHVRARRDALVRGDRGVLGWHTRASTATHQLGTFESLFRLLRTGILELIEPDLERAFATPTRLLDTLRASSYWPALFTSTFADPMLHAMFGPAATQHAAAGSYPGYFQRAFERGLGRDDASANYFLRHVLIGDYVEGCAPDFFQHDTSACALELLEASLLEVPALERFACISLSNIFDWSDDALVASWATHLAAHAAPGTQILIRQLNNQRDLRPFFAGAFRFDDALGASLQERDRSLFYERVVVAVRT